MNNVNNNIGTDSYKGVRDFYPDDLRRRQYIETRMSQTVEQFGYEAIDASVIEPADLYDAKSGEELAGEQSYRFVDRGDREIMLRPEMTPTVARMLAAQAKSLPFPVRWYSIANVFRYERPQRGRLREHWQLNADIFGVDDMTAELEVITLAHQLMKNLGAAEDDFVIYINSRELFRQLCDEVLDIDEETRATLSGIIDKKDKMEKGSFNGAVTDLLSTEAAEKLQTYLSINEIDGMKEAFPALAEPLEKLDKVLTQLEAQDIGNAVFDPGLIRGLAYYTGVVFEVFDTHPENNRSLFGGGRYDNLMDVFGTEPVPAVGFGAGDVTLADFLDAHELWPELPTKLDVDICLVEKDEHYQFGYRIADQLRDIGLRTRVNISGSSVGTQLKRADNDKATYVIIIGDDEIENESVTIKELSSGEQQTLKLEDLKSYFTKSE